MSTLEFIDLLKSINLGGLGGKSGFPWFYQIIWCLLVLKQAFTFLAPQPAKFCALKSAFPELSYWQTSCYSFCWDTEWDGPCRHGPWVWLGGLSSGRELSNVTILFLYNQRILYKCKLPTVMCVSTQRTPYLAPAIFLDCRVILSIATQTDLVHRILIFIIYLPIWLQNSNM